MSNKLINISLNEEDKIAYAYLKEQGINISALVRNIIHMKADSIKREQQAIKEAIDKL